MIYEGLKVLVVMIIDIVTFPLQNDGRAQERRQRL